MSAPLRRAPLAPWCGFVLACVLACAPRPARASSEEFASFDVARTEEDDESALDHWLTRFPREWQGEWLAERTALRTAQGCFTSGQWFMDTEFKTATPLGERATFAIGYTDVESDVERHQFLDFAVRFPNRFGIVGVSFRPLYDKSRHDYGVFWENAPESSAVFVRATFGLEDFFNNLWAARQSRVGDVSEPFDRHPWEPALEAAVRRGRVRGELRAKWLTPSIRRTQQGYATVLVPTEQRLWGARGEAALETDALGATWRAHGSNLQAQSSEHPAADTTFAATLVAAEDRYRRTWSAGGSARRAFGPRVAVEAGGVYQERRGRWSPPSVPASFDAIGRLYHAEVAWTVKPGLVARIGGLFDRITVARSTALESLGYGTRNETRAYLGLAARFGNVSVYGVEGFELDHEPYDVVLVHDKGFLGLMARF